MKTEDLREKLKVYFIMGSTNCLSDPEETLKQACEGGITLFQFREKGTQALKEQQKLNLGGKLKEICHQYSVPFIVNDDIDLAVRLGADGVHIGQEDEPAEKVRKKIGSGILGVSVHTLEEARAAIEQGADYLGIGPIYKTTTKEDAKEVQGVQLLTRLREEGITIPIVGIGGITASNAEAVIKAGADGVSVITAISQADSAKNAAKQLRESVQPL
nr:thiamine phosphate synthase [Metabacillus lacus]